MENLINRISVLFRKYGIKSVTMDDISRELGISKKTLYQHFENKNDVVYKIANFEIKLEFDELNNICSKNKHVIDQLKKISQYIIERNFALNPSLIYSMDKYYHQMWEELLNKRQEFILNLINKNLRKGVKQRIFREDIDFGIIHLFYMFLVNIRSIEMHIDWSVENFEQIFDTIFLYHIRSIATNKGIEYLGEKISTRS